MVHYRVSLFESLRTELDRRGVDLMVAHGQPSHKEEARNDGGVLPWALPLPARYVWGNRLVWQNPGRALDGADLVILTHENRLLYNLLALTLKRPPRLAFWGHGRDFQSLHPDGLREKFKRTTALLADWWFAYTELSAALLVSYGFARDRISVVDNATDTASLVADQRALTELDVNAFRAQWRLGDGPIALAMGSLDARKRIPMLVAAGEELARLVPGFQLVIVGDGPDRTGLRAAAERRPWLHALGARYGREKAVCLRAAQLVLNPGMVGLGILDAFAAGVPLVTTACGIHSPEIAYLRHDENGVMTANDLGAFVHASAMLLRDTARCRRLGDRAAEDARRYGVEQMVQKFSDGVLAALRLPARCRLQP